MKRRLNIRNLFLLIMVLIFFIILIMSIIKIIGYKQDNKDNKKVQEKTLEKVEVKNNKYNIDFKALKDQNKDTVAYLKVNGTNIDYIVVRGEDNEYYLRHNFERDWNVSGWIFADYKNSFNGDDKNIVIYGHDTRDGSMFGTLRNVLNSSWSSNKNNLTVALVTEKGEYYYEVFSTYDIRPEDFYIKTDFYDNEFKDFVKIIKSRSDYDYEADVTENDKILTLSSCIKGGKKRVVLHAKLIEDID